MEAIENAARGLRDARLTPVHYRAVLRLVDAVQQHHTGPAAFAVFRRELLEAQQATQA